MAEPRIVSPVTDNLFPEAWKGTPGNGTSSTKGEFSVKIVKNLKIAEFKKCLIWQAQLVTTQFVCLKYLRNLQGAPRS